MITNVLCTVSNLIQTKTVMYSPSKENTAAGTFLYIYLIDFSRTYVHVYKYKHISKDIDLKDKYVARIGKNMILA